MSRTRRNSHNPRPAPGSARLLVSLAACPRGLAAPVRKAVLHTFARHGYHSGQVCIAFISKAHMRKQHKTWLDHDSPTDVLTFNLADAPHPGCVDAQLLICPAVARDRARAARTSWRSETLLYIVHGCLHLCGYDDRSPKSFARIHRMENRLLTDLGHGPVFDQAPPRRTDAPRRPLRSRP